MRRRRTGYAMIPYDWVGPDEDQIEGGAVEVYMELLRLNAKYGPGFLRTHAQIAEECGRSQAWAAKHCRSLRSKNFIRTEPRSCERGDQMANAYWCLRLVDTGRPQGRKRIPERASTPPYNHEGGAPLRSHSAPPYDRDPLPKSPERMAVEHDAGSELDPSADPTWPDDKRAFVARTGIPWEEHLRQVRSAPAPEPAPHEGSSGARSAPAHQAAAEVAPPLRLINGVGR
jgi:hypothetical protein